MQCNGFIYKYIVNDYHNYSVIIIDSKAGMRRCLSVVFYCISLVTRDVEHLFTNLFSSVQFSRSVASDSSRPHELQHARPPCPSLTPGFHPNSCASSRWCHLAISSSAIPFSSCPQSLPASGSFPMSQLFTWGGQTFGVSASASSFQWTPRTDLL